MSEQEKTLLASLSERLNREAASPGFDEAFTLHYRAVFRTATALVRDRTLAEDITQEVFLRLYRNLDSTPGEELLRAWLLRVTMNVARNTLRAQGRASSRQKESVERTEIGRAVAASPEEEYEHRVEIEEARRALNNIKEPMRSCLLLKQQGLTYREIGEVLSINEANVGSLIARGRKEFVRSYGKVSNERATRMDLPKFESKVDLLVALLSEREFDYITPEQATLEEPNDEAKAAVDSYINEVEQILKRMQQYQSEIEDFQRQTREIIIKLQAA
jgi:RNA polymerase sigma-70 factor (ECF subfamily)